MMIAYGATELSPVCTSLFPDSPEEKLLTTVGKSVGHVENKVIDSNGDVVPVNTSGELCTRGFGVMKGYWQDPEKTNKAIDVEGWYHTGDIGVMDEDGYVQVTGRIKDMIIRGGENLYPTEIENFIVTHPKVEKVQVFGVPSKRYGEDVAAWIQIKEGVDLTADDVKEFCKGKITHFKIPKYIKFVTSFPMTVTGKAQKFKMTEEYSKELGGSVD